MRGCGLGFAVSHVEVDLALGEEEAENFDSDFGRELEEGGGCLRVGSGVGWCYRTSWVAEGGQRVESVGDSLRFVGFVIGFAPFFAVDWSEKTGWEYGAQHG